MASGKTEESTIVMPALGRPFRLGMLYDRRSETLLEREPLWSADLIDQHTSERRIDKLEEEVVEDDTFSERAKALDMDDSLRLSSLARLVDLAGSAQYLKSRKSQNESQAALKLKYIASMKELDMNELKKASHLQLGEDSQVIATHVVSAIAIGSQGIFTLNQSILDGKATSDIQTNLNMLTTKMCKNMRGCKKGVVKKMDKDDIDNVRCTYFADHLNKRVRLSLAEMADICEKFTGKKETTPITVWLHPMNSIESTVSSDVKLVRVQIVDQIQDGIEKLQKHLEYRGLDNQTPILGRYFPGVENSLVDFQKMIVGFIGKLEHQLASDVPRVRGSTMDEADLLHIVEIIHRSPFAAKGLEKWMENKRKEAEVLGLYATVLSKHNITFMKDSTELKLKTFESDYLLCFAFKLPEDIGLLAMNKSLGAGCQTKTECNQAQAWPNNQQDIEAVDKALMRFVKFVKCNPDEGIEFVAMTAIMNAEESLKSSIVLYKDMDMVSDNFLLPSAPGQPSCFSAASKTIELKWKPVDEGYEHVTHYEVHYQATGESVWNCDTTVDRCEQISITNLVENSSYKFKACAVCVCGEGPFGKMSKPISTKTVSCETAVKGLNENSMDEIPARAETKDIEGAFGDISKPISAPTYLPSEPGEPYCIETNSSSITIEWEKPDRYPERVSYYEILHRQLDYSDQREWDTLQTNQAVNTAIINNLATERDYEFKVLSVCQGRKGPIGRTSTAMSIAKRLLPPGKPFCREKSESSATIQWGEPACSSKTITQYIVRYRHSDSSEWIHCKTGNCRCFFTVEKLHEKSYQFQVCAAGDHGEEGPYGDISDDVHIFQPPSEPGEPKKRTVSDSSITIVWPKPKLNAEGIQQYDVRYRREGAVNWTTKHTGNTACSTKLVGLAAATSYECQVRAMCQEGNGPFGKMSNCIQTFTPPSQPGKPVGLGATTNSITIKWQPAKHTIEAIHHYDIRLRCCGASEWTMTHTDDDSYEATVDGLNTECPYEFGVRSVCLEGHGDFGETSSPIVTTSSTPTYLTSKDVKKDSIAITLGNPQQPLIGQVKYYEVRWKQAGTESWRVHYVPPESVIIEGLIEATAYEVERCAIYEGSKGLPARFRKAIMTKKANDNPPSSPGKPQPRHVAIDRMQLTWSKPINGYECVEKCELWCTKKGESEDLKVLQTEKRTEDLVVEELAAAREYRIKVRALCQVDRCGVGYGQFGPTERVTTNAGLARQVVTQSKKTSNSTPATYRIPLKTISCDRQWHTRICELELGKTKASSRRGQFEKTIMLVGATGSGKSTLVNGLMNYLVDTQFQDPFRFTLVDLMDDEKKKVGNQAESQTDWITMYKVPAMEGGRQNVDLNLIDTPGFGDTKGIARDKQLIDQIRQFFNSVDRFGLKTIDAVCFVVSAPSARLTPTQKYIYDGILSIFGKDIADNIFAMITFADGSAPPVLNALKAAEIPNEPHFRFNNSALFEDNTEQSSGSFTNMFWTLGRESFDNFFKNLKLASPKSLKMTKEVLQERERLEITIRGLQPQIRQGLSSLDEIKTEVGILKHHEMTREDNKIYEYTATKHVSRKVDLEDGHHVTNCLHCHITCHEDCLIVDSDEKYRCYAMDSDQEDSVRQCRICKGKCHWKQHFNDKFRIEWETVSTKETYADKKKRHEEAAGHALTHGQIISKLTNNFSQLQGDVCKLIDTARKSINRLREIALKPNPLTVLEYLDVLICSEKAECKPGFQSRLDFLDKLSKEAELMRDIENPTFKPWYNLLEESLDDQFQNYFPSAGSATQPKLPSVAGARRPQKSGGWRKKLPWNK